MAKNDDERKARARFIDQPGQWVDKTPPSVKKKQDKAWNELRASLEKDEKWKGILEKDKKPAPKGAKKSSPSKKCK